MNHYINRLRNTGGITILGKTENDGVGIVLIQAANRSIRLIQYDLEEAQHEGAECVISTRSWAKDGLDKAKAAFAREAK